MHYGAKQRIMENNNCKLDTSILLIPFKDCINRELYEMYQDIPKEEIGSINKLYGVSYDEFLSICEDMIQEEIGSINKLYGVSYDEFLSICEDMIQEEKIINEEIHTSTKRFILFINSLPIGEVGIRTTQNDFWVNKGSQIYYRIRKSQRNKGYGNTIFQLALLEAKKLHFEKIRVNCDNNNIASKKIIMKNGGKIDIPNYKTKDGYSSSYIISFINK